MNDEQELGELYINKANKLCRKYDVIEAIVYGYYTDVLGNVCYELVKAPKNN